MHLLFLCLFNCYSFLFVNSMDLDTQRVDKWVVLILASLIIISIYQFNAMFYEVKMIPVPRPVLFRHFFCPRTATPLFNRGVSL